MVDVPDGLNVVAVRGNGFASVLYLGGESARLHAADCQGSVGCLAARAAPAAHAKPGTPAAQGTPTAQGHAEQGATAAQGHAEQGTTAAQGHAEQGATAASASRPPEVEALRDWLAAPGLSVRTPPPVEPLRPLLRLLAPGRYTIAISSPGWRELPVLDPAPGATRGWYWPAQGDALIVTAPWPPRDTGTVDRYLARIAAGDRPAAVTVRSPGGGPRYLLDGHHKLAAYRRAGMRPLLLEITPERPMPLPRAEFAALVPAAVRGEFTRPLEDWPMFGPPPDGEEA